MTMGRFGFFDDCGTGGETIAASDMIRDIAGLVQDTIGSITVTQNVSNMLHVLKGRRH